jgi:hypothetical protein
MCHQPTCLKNAHCERNLKLGLQDKHTISSTAKQDVAFFEAFQGLDAPVTLIRCNSENDISAGSNLPGLKSIARLWRKDPAETGFQSSPLRKLPVRGHSVDPSSADSTVSTVQEEQMNTEDIKQRWRKQQIANQVKFSGQKNPAWISWLLRSRIPLRFLPRLRSEK